MSELTHIAQCIYCGQTHMVEQRGGETPETLNQRATGKCDCKQARHMQQVEKAKTKAESNIENLFGQMEEDMINLLKAAVLPIMEDHITGITIDTGRKVKAKISKTSKGNMKVERIDTRKAALES